MENEIMSESICKLAEALSKAQGEFKAIAKAGEVDFTNKAGKRTKYAFATYQQMQDACLPALIKNGLSYTTLPQRDGSMVGLLMHTSGQWVKGHIHIAATGGQYGITPQDIGSAQTYMQKYLFKSAMCVPTDDDDGLGAASKTKKTGNDDANAAVGGKSKPKPQQAVDVFASLVAYCKKKGIVVGEEAARKILKNNGVEFDDQLKQLGCEPAFKIIKIATDGKIIKIATDGGSNE